MSDRSTSPSLGRSAPAAHPSGRAVLPGLGRLRVFSSDAERLAADWSKYPEAPLPWAMDPNVVAQPGVEGGFWVAAAPYRGYAKPLNRARVDPTVFPIAAVEKIAADLAHRLHLCVPPVTLWERATAPTGEPRYHSVSAPPFDQIMRWEDVVNDPVLYPAIAPLAVPAMSAMVAFDTWVGCDDHVNHGGNLLVTVKTGPPIAGNFAFIDYSYSMVYKWRNDYRAAVVVPMYDTRLVPDQAVMREAVDAISHVSDLFIEQTVGRIPDPFLSLADKATIMDGLKYRRDHLRQTIGSVYHGVL